jgi:ribosomal protein S18 acetylase RimI-like enzyme
MIGAFGTRALGFVSLHETFPGARLRSMWYLKEIFVTGSVRGLGIGEGLMRVAAREVVRRGGSRMEFTTDMSNTAAQSFYRRMGAPVVPKVFYRYEAEALDLLAASDLP